MHPQIQVQLAKQFEAIKPLKWPSHAQEYFFQLSTRKCWSGLFSRACNIELAPPPFLVSPECCIENRKTHASSRRDFGRSIPQTSPEKFSPYVRRQQLCDETLDLGLYAQGTPPVFTRSTNLESNLIDYHHPLVKVTINCAGGYWHSEFVALNVSKSRNIKQQYGEGTRTMELQCIIDNISMSAWMEASTKGGLGDASVLKQEPAYWKRRVLEAIAVQRHAENTNLDCGLILNPIWTSFMKVLTWTITLYHLSTIITLHHVLSTYQFVSLSIPIYSCVHVSVL